MPRTKNAISNRVHVRSWLLAALVGGLPLASHAGYAQLSPPSGFGGSAGNWTYAPSANDVRYGATAHSPNSLRFPVPGTTATMSASYRFAANAPRIAAAVLFAHPAVRTAVGIASWLGIAKIVWDASQQKWLKETDGISKQWSFNPQQFGWSPTAQSACQALISYQISNGASQGFDYSAMTGYVNDGVCIRVFNGYETAYPLQSRDVQDASTRPLTKEEFERELAPEVFTPGAPSTMPQTVPFELPKPTPLPIQQPIINPEPSENPQPRPLFVPTGDPVPNPQYDPNTAPGPNNQPFIQPGTRVTPSPTPSEPWRVDVQPVNRPQAGPAPLPEPAPDDPANPDKPKNEEQQSLCEKHPDILACAKPELDTPEGEIPKTTREVTLTEENLFSGGSCPADVYFTPHGLQQLKVWDWNQSCGYITAYVKPILLICCTFAAFMILIPGRTE